MTDEKWETLVEQIQRKFEVTEHLKEAPGADRSAREVLVFQGPAGPMKLERVTRPVILEKKPIYSRRIGSGTAYEYVFHPTARTNREQLFRWSGHDWVEMDLSTIGR